MMREGVDTELNLFSLSEGRNEFRENLEEAKTTKIVRV